MPDVGSTIAGKYRIDRPIGAGGMGTVVAATHLQLGTPVALKFLHDKIRESPSSVERFTREAKACAQLRSQHICRVSDFGIEDGLPYIAMELLEGIDLAHLLDRGPTGVDKAVDYVMQACIGLAEAHGLGIVHRDLKPGNLFLANRPDGSRLVKVLDFGVAKVPVDSDRALTQTATIIGSPGYMAPEQLRSSKTVDARADVWALGIILYELITCRHPFHAKAVTEIAVKIAMDDPVPLTEAPAAIRDVVMRCLEKDPERRYSDASALAAALAPFAPKGMAAAAIASRFLNDGAENRQTMQRPAGMNEITESPATVDERGGATKVRDSRPRFDRGGERPIQPEKKSSRTWIVVLGVVALLAAGAVAIAVVLVGSERREQPLSVVDPKGTAAVPGLSPPTPDASDFGGYPAAKGILDIKITGVVVATILVDGAEWGVGQRISREVTAGAHEIEVRATGRDPVRRTVDGPGTITIDVPGKSPPSATDAAAATRAFATIRATAATVNEKITRASARLLAKGLLSEEVPNGPQLRNQIRAAVRVFDLGKADRLADQLLAAIEAIQIDRAFITAKLARMTERSKGLSPDDPARKKITNVLADVMHDYNEGAYVPANVKLSVIAGLLARASSARPIE